MNDPINASTINDFIFCPASIYFHGFYLEMNNETFQSKIQVTGTNCHTNIDNNTYSTKKNILTSIDGYCQQFNLQCKIDIYYKDEKRLVERKKKIHRIYDGQIFQIYSQYFCLKELGYDVETLEIYSMEDNKKYKINLPEDDIEMYNKFKQTISQINNFNILNFKAINIEKCKNCIYSKACFFSLKDE